MQNKFRKGMVPVFATCLAVMTPSIATFAFDSSSIHEDQLNVRMGHDYGNSNFVPDFDIHQRRVRIQLNPTTISQNAQQTMQGVYQGEQASPKEPFPNRSSKPVLNEYNGRKLITLDHGSADNPFIVRDAGVSAAQLHIVSNVQVAKGTYAHRTAQNYADAKTLQRAKTPKTVEEFDQWAIGDWVLKTGVANVALGAGIGTMAGDLRFGGGIRSKWSRRIEKIDANLIRVSFINESATGPSAYAKTISLHKAKDASLGAVENTYVYVFDLKKQKESDALNTLLHTRMLRANHVSPAQDEEQGNGLVSTHKTVRNQHTNSLIQFGIPYLFRYRHARHVEAPVAVIADHERDVETKHTTHAYVHQDLHHAISGWHNGKKWKVSHAQQQYNRLYAGSVVSDAKISDQEGMANRSDSLSLKLSFSHDNARVSKVNKFADEIARRVGITNFMIDTGYAANARIGFVEIVYSLEVDGDALLQLQKNIDSHSHDYGKFAHDLIDDYFYTDRDPNRICFSSHPVVQRHCIDRERAATMASLKRIKKYLKHLYPEGDAPSTEVSATYLAKIAKELAVNHFVLQTFLAALPSKTDGYGKLEIYGERFLPVEFSTDTMRNNSTSQK